MSTLTAERLYALLPSVYRLRDAEQPGEPLRALIAALAGQFAVLEENIEQLYDDQFIETCANWAAPYIGDLVGYRPLHGVPDDVFSARAEVANTIAYRRRKGTALMLEQLAGDVTGWPAHAVEYFELLATSQYMNHIRLHAPVTANLHNLTGCLREGGAFAPFAHTAEMRSPEGGSGRYNIPNIGLFLWRLLPFGLTALPLVAHPGDASGRKFRVNPLGADLRLFRRPRAEDDIAHLAEPINVPEPLSVRLMALAVKAAQATGLSPVSDNVLDDDYGPGESIVLLRPVPQSNPQDPPIPVSVDEIVICDLRDILDSGGNVIGWNHEHSLPQSPPLPQGKIGLDPERGRVLHDNAPLDPLLATFHYGAASRIGGGDYERTPPGSDLAQTTIVTPMTLPLPLPPMPIDLQPSLTAIAVGGRLRIEDSLTYAAATVTVDPPTPAHPEGRVVVAARNSCRPLVVTPTNGEIELKIAPHGELVLDGIVFSGGPLHLRVPIPADDEPRELVLRDCTLVPGLALDTDGSALHAGSPSLIIDHPFTKVRLLRCITGPLHIAGDVEVTMKDCIVDAGAPEKVAYAAPTAAGPGGILNVSESTIIGKVHAKRIDMASNSIFFAGLGPAPPETWTAPVRAERRQKGCMRFCYVPAGSITPRRYRCVPNEDHPAALPQFTSLRYGDPGYGQLRGVTERAIRMGADDESEMGVLHDLYQPQREANLRIRLEEYLRFGLRAGIFYAT